MIETNAQNVALKEVTIEFSIANLLNRNFISKLNISNLTIDNQTSDQESNILGLIDFLKNIEELNIKDLNVRFSETANYIRVDLNSFAINDGLSLLLTMRDDEGDELEIGLLPSSDSGSPFFKGFVKANKFTLDRNLLKNFCDKCESSIEIQTYISFNFFNNKALNLKGNLDFNLDKDIFGIKSFNSSFKLKDSNQASVQVTSFKDKIDKSVENLIKLLIENKRLLVLPEIASFFEELKDADEGVVEANIIMAEEPSKKTVDDLIKSLEKRFNKKIEGKVEINKSIIGGTKIIVGDTVIDASVRGQLDNLAYTLKA